MNTEAQAKPVLVSFGSSDLDWPLRRFQRQAVRSQLFSQVSVLTESDLNQSFKRRFGAFLSKEVKGFGYWIWKPQSVSQVIKELPTGTLVVYLDLGCHIFPEPSFDWGALYDLCLNSPCRVVAFQDEPGDSISFEGSLERVWTKGDLFDFFGVRENAAITGTPQVAAAAFALVVGEDSLAFLDAWLEPIFADMSLVDDSPSKSSDLRGFIEHRYDQSVFSILCKLLQSAILPQDLLQAKKLAPERHVVSSLPWVVARDKHRRLKSGLINLRLRLRRFKNSLFFPR